MEMAGIVADLLVGGVAAAICCHVVQGYLVGFSCEHKASLPS